MQYLLSLRLSEKIGYNLQIDAIASFLVLNEFPAGSGLDRTAYLYVLEEKGGEERRRVRCLILTFNILYDFCDNGLPIFEVRRGEAVDHSHHKIFIVLADRNSLMHLAKFVKLPYYNSDRIEIH